MNLKIRLLYLLVNLCHGDWLCGDALIEDQAACLCGNKTFTRDASYNDDINCCGPDTCIITVQYSTGAQAGRFSKNYLLFCRIKIQNRPKSLSLSKSL